MPRSSAATPRAMRPAMIQPTTRISTNARTLGMAAKNMAMAPARDVSMASDQSLTAGNMIVTPGSLLLGEEWTLQIPYRSFVEGLRHRRPVYDFVGTPSRRAAQAM